MVAIWYQLKPRRNHHKKGRIEMLTEEDFAEAEEAVKAISDKCMKSESYALSLSEEEKTLYNFAKNVLLEARRDFLTEVDTKPQKEIEIGMDAVASALVLVNKFISSRDKAINFLPDKNGDNIGRWISSFLSITNYNLCFYDWIKLDVVREVLQSALGACMKETPESVDAQDKEFEPYYKPMQLKHS